MLITQEHEEQWTNNDQDKLTYVNVMSKNGTTILLLGFNQFINNLKNQLYRRKYYFKS